MRIISGKSRGTKLYTLDGLETRPTLDRVKESFFNIINNEIYDSTVLDLFSGSGAIGLEFASRGARKVYLCDKSSKAIEIIKKNIQKTHCEEKVELYNCDFKKMLENLKDKKINLIYLDPPYNTDYIIESLKKIVEYDLLDENGIIIAETDDPNRVEDLKNIENLNLEIYDKRNYGRAYLFFLKIKKA